MNGADENWVVIFAKCPRPGRVKTRLARLLGHEGACLLYEALLVDTALAVASVSGIRRVIACDPPEDLDWFAARFGEPFVLTSQGPGDLGARLERTFDEAFALGARRAVVVGSDLPTLTPSCLDAAFRDLATHDLVLGPADDGGYYLIGLARSAAQLFRGIDWSTDRVLAQTLERAERSDLTSSRLARECDVDDESSLRKLMTALAVGPATSAPNTRRFLAGLDSEFHWQEMTAWK